VKEDGMMEYIICMRGMRNKYVVVDVMPDGKRCKPITPANGPKLEDVWKRLGVSALPPSIVYGGWTCSAVIRLHILRGTQGGPLTIQRLNSF
jgi:hypothetical protein